MKNYWESKKSEAQSLRMEMIEKFLSCGFTKDGYVKTKEKISESEIQEVKRILRKKNEEQVGGKSKLGSCYIYGVDKGQS